MGVVIAILAVLLVVVTIATVASIKKQAKQNKLKKASDYAFKTKHGTYSFDYLIKGYKKEDGLTLVILIAVIIGFSDLSSFNTNSCLEVTVKAVDADGLEFEETYSIADLIKEMQQEEYDRLYSEYEDKLEKHNEKVQKDIEDNAKLIEHGVLTEEEIIKRHAGSKPVSPAPAEDLLIQKTSFFKLNPTVKVNLGKDFTNPIKVTVSSTWCLSKKVVDNEVLDFTYDK